MHATGSQASGRSPSKAGPRPGHAHASDCDAATGRALTQGGDARITLSSVGVNLYGCPPRPDTSLIAFGSSTASVVSGPGFRAAATLHARLRTQPWSHRRDAIRLRQTLLDLIE